MFNCKLWIETIEWHPRRLDGSFVFFCARSKLCYCITVHDAYGTYDKDTHDQQGNRGSCGIHMGENSTMARVTMPLLKTVAFSSHGGLDHVASTPRQISSQSRSSNEMSVLLAPSRSLGFRRMFFFIVLYSASHLGTRPSHPGRQALSDNHKPKFPASRFQSQDYCSKGDTSRNFCLGILFLSTLKTVVLCAAEFWPSRTRRERRGFW